VNIKPFEVVPASKILISNDDDGEDDDDNNNNMTNVPS